MKIWHALATVVLAVGALSGSSQTKAAPGAVSGGRQGRPTPTPPYNVICAPLPNGDSICYGSHQMQTTTSLALRSAVFIVPDMDVVPSADPTVFASPNIQATIEVNSDNYPMVLNGTQLTKNPGGNKYLQINVTGTLLGGQASSPLPYTVHLTVIGHMQKSAEKK